MGNLLVARGLTTRVRVEECITLRERSRAKGQAPPSLAELLVEKGYVSRAALDQTVRVGAASARPGPALPAEVTAALRDPQNDLGPYVKLKQLGRGGMGEVWKAWDRPLGRFVAVKFLLGGESEDEKRFVREAQLAAGLSHPNIAQVYGVGRHLGRPYLVMQLVNGATIDRVTLTPRETIAAIRDAARAIDVAHKAGIVHRDLKPGNLMMEGGRVYVMDFGLARATRVDSSISQSGMILGTPQFMPPEQAEGRTREVGPRSDVYSLGATLYALVARRPPFEAEGGDVIGLLRKISTEDPPPPRRWNPSIPSEVETIILKALEREPDRRYASAAELADDLQRHLDGDAILGRRASVAYRLRKRLVKHKWIVGAVGAAVIALGFFAYIWLSGSARASDKQAAVAEMKRHRKADRWEDALGACERALALDPADASLRAAREELRNRVGRRIAEGETQRLFGPVEQELQALRLRTYKPGYRLSEDQVQEYGRLEERIREQMGKSGESAQGHYLLGRIRHLLGDRRGATESFDFGLKLAPDHAGCLVFKARVMLDLAIRDYFTGLRGLGKENSRKAADATAAEASRLIEQAFRRKVEGVTEFEVDLVKGYERVARKWKTREYADEMLKKWQGRDFAEEFLLVRALGSPAKEMVVDTAEAIRLRASFAEAHFWRGVALMGLNDHAAALPELDRAIEINPRYAEAYLNRGSIRSAGGDPAAALRDFERALEIEPGYAEAWYNRGHLFVASDPKRAEREFSRAIELRSDMLQAYNERSSIRLKLNDLKGAEEDALRVMELEPTAPEGFIMRGIVRAGRGDRKGAREDFETAIRVAPDEAVGYYNLGNALREEGKSEEAIRRYGEAIQRDPAHIHSYFNRATTFEELGDRAGALKDWNRLLEIDPNYRDALQNRGVLHMREGRLREALGDFDRAIKLGQPGAEILVNRGVTRHNLAARGPADAEALARGAVEDLERALALASADWPARKMVEGFLEAARKAR